MNIIEDVYKWLETAGVEQTGTIKQFELAVSLIEEELEELKEAHSKNDKEEQTDAIVDLLWVTLNWAYMNGLDAQTYSKLVSESNWSKFCKTLEEAQASQRAYYDGVHPSKPNQIILVDIEEANGFWILKNQDGKIMKSLNYKSVKELKDGKLHR